MEGKVSSDGGSSADQREAAHLRIALRLLDELGDKADDHCLTITYYLVRAGCLADQRLVLHFASRAARVALEHKSYFVAGRYFQAAASAGARELSLDERATLYCRAAGAFERWPEPTPSADCYRQAARLYEQSGNETGRLLALQAIGEAGNDDEPDEGLAKLAWR